MSQKIVIKANVKREPHNSAAAVSYEWHWRRIVSTAMLMIITSAAIIYGLTVSVNADQDKPDNTQQRLLSSGISNVDAEPEMTANDNVIAKTAVTATSLQGQLPQTSSAVNEVTDSVVPPATDLAMQPAVEAPLMKVNEGTPEQSVEQPKPAVAKVSSPQTAMPNNALAAGNGDSDAPESTQSFAPLAKVASVALGAQIDTDKISRAVLTRSVSKREPVNVFAADIRLSQFSEALSFFSELKNLQGQHIKHVWLFEGKKMAEIELSVTSPRYRTYSTKRISDSQVGNWRVDVIDEQGLLLAQKEFRVLAD